jgi:hypothetical protein
MCGLPVPSGHLVKPVPQLLPGCRASTFLRCHGADLWYGNATNHPCGLEPLTAIREMGHQDTVISYFLLRGGKEGYQRS